MIVSNTAIAGKYSGDEPITVLLVEDTQATRELILDVFEHANIGRFQLTAAIRLAEAKTALLEKTFDLIILDLGLPDSSGLDTLETVSILVESTPVIVLTGNDDRTLGREAINLGAQDFIVKGFGAESLLPRVAYYTIERHRAHLQAVRSEMFLRASIDSLPSRIAIIDGAGTTRFLNRAWTKQYPHSTNEIQTAAREGDNFFSTCLPLICNDDTVVEQLQQMAQNVLAGNTGVSETEYRHLTENDENWYRARITPLLAAEQESLVITVEDITARKRTAIDLYRSREYLRVIFDTSPNLVFVKDEMGRYIMANRAMGEMFGLEPEQIVGKTDVELFHKKSDAVRRMPGLSPA